jgi:hypothetical protein
VKKIACDKFEEVGIVDFVEVLTSCRHRFLDAYQLLLFFFR